MESIIEFPIIFVFDSKYYNETTISNILNKLLEPEEDHTKISLERSNRLLK